MISSYRGKFVHPIHDVLVDSDFADLQAVAGVDIPNPLRDFLKEFHGSFVHYAIRVPTEDEHAVVPFHTILHVLPEGREAKDQPTSITGFLRHHIEADDSPSTFVPFAFTLPGAPLLCDIANAKSRIMMFGYDLDMDDEFVCIFPSFDEYVDAWFVDDEHTRTQISMSSQNSSQPFNEIPYIEWLTKAVPDWRVKYADVCPERYDAE